MTTRPTLVKRQSPNGQTVIVLPRDYLERERDRLIARLRDLDHMLGRPQTIPERQR